MIGNSRENMENEPIDSICLQVTKAEIAGSEGEATEETKSTDLSTDQDQKEIDDDKIRQNQDVGNSPDEIKSNDDEPSQEDDEELTIFSRKIIIEPAIILMYMFGIPEGVLAGQYYYYFIGEKYNLSAWLVNEEPHNDSAGSDHTEGLCGGLPNVNSTAYRLQQKVQAETAMFNFYMDLTVDIPGIIVLLFFGTLIDQIGRRPGLIIPLIGIIIKTIIFIIQIIAPLPLEFLFLGTIIETLCGGGVTFLSAAFAFYADTIPAHIRGRRLSIADVSFGLSFALMSFLIGIMIENLGFFWPYVIILFGHVMNLLYVLFAVPESRKRRKGQQISISPRYIIDSFKVLPKSRPGNGRNLLWVMVAAWFIINFARDGSRDMDTLYKLNSPFCWNAIILGTYTSVSALLLFLTEFLVAMFLIKPLGDLWVIVMALCSSVAEHVVTGVASKTWMLWLAAIAGCASGAQTPVMRAVLSKLVLHGEQGALWASLSVVDKILAIPSSYMFNAVYAESLYFFKGMGYILVAILLTIATGFVLLYRKWYNKEPRNLDSHDQTDNYIAWENHRVLTRL